MRAHVCKPPWPSSTADRLPSRRAVSNVVAAAGQQHAPRARTKGRMGNPLFATKSVDHLLADAEHAHGFKRALTAFDLTMLGIGAIIGTGIFVLTGRAAAANAGPAVCL